MIATGFAEIKVPPRVGWDGVVAQILDSATDGEIRRFFRISIPRDDMFLFLLT